MNILVQKAGLSGTDIVQKTLTRLIWARCSGECRPHSEGCRSQNHKIDLLACQLEELVRSIRRQRTGWAQSPTASLALPCSTCASGPGTSDGLLAKTTTGHTLVGN